MKLPIFSMLEPNPFIQHYKRAFYNFRSGPGEGLFIIWWSGGLSNFQFECRFAGTFVFIWRFTVRKLGVFSLEEKSKKKKKKKNESGLRSRQS